MYRFKVRYTDWRGHTKFLFVEASSYNEAYDKARARISALNGEYLGIEPVARLS